MNACHFLNLIEKSEEHTSETRFLWTNPAPPPRNFPDLTPALLLSRSLHLSGPRRPAHERWGRMIFRETLPISPVSLIQSAPKPASPGKLCARAGRPWTGAASRRDSRMQPDSGQTSVPSPQTFGLPSPGAAVPGLPLLARWSLGHPQPLPAVLQTGTYRAQQSMGSCLMGSGEVASPQGRTLLCHPRPWSYTLPTPSSCV